MNHDMSDNWEETNEINKLKDKVECQDQKIELLQNEIDKIRKEVDEIKK